MNASLDNIFFPYTVHTFTQHAWQKTICVGSATTGRYQQLCSWDTINSMLTSHRMLPPRLRLMRSGQQISPYNVQYRQPPFVLNSEAFLRELRNGASLVIDFVDEIHGPLRILSEDMSNTFNAAVNVNLYAGWGTDRAFDPHYDPQENVILQVYGRKHWKVWEPTVSCPLSAGVVKNGDPPSRLVWDGVLEDGAWLYLPRGWWHVAYPMDEPTVHLTLTISPPRFIDFIRWVTEQSANAKSGKLGEYIGLIGRASQGASLREEEYFAPVELELTKYFTQEMLERFTYDAVSENRFPSVALPSLEHPVVGLPSVVAVSAAMPESENGARDSYQHEVA